MQKDRLSLTTRAALLVTTALLATPALANSDAALAPEAAPSADQPAEAPEVSDDEDEDAIVVTGQRLQGQLDTDFTADVELDEAAIASYGVSSIEELLEAIEPITRSGRGRGSGRPVILVNGRRISGFGAVRNIPPEAIAKVEVFPEEVALQYGYAATERVVNIVLKPNFRQISAEGEAGVPTQGGQFKSELEPGFIAIGETGRLNLNAGWEHQTMLRESERDLDYDSAARAAEAPARSLSPARDEYMIEGTIVRNLDKVTDVQASLRFDQTDSLSLLGPGPGGVDNPLRRDSRTQNWTGSASANGMLGGWRWSVTGNYSDSDQRILTERATGVGERFDSSQRDIGANANIAGSVIDGWAGPVRASITGGFTSARYDSRTAAGGLVTTTDLGRDTPSVFGSLTVPLLDPDYGVGKIGRLSLTLNAEAERPSDFSSLTSWGATVNWGLTGNLSLIASYKRDEAAPTMTQLGAAPLTTPDVTTYDFATGQTVEITTISGGNPALLAEKRRDIKIGLNWDVPMVDGLGFSIDYNENRSDDTSNSFPLLTPEIEAAFPDRVLRDANGTLLAIDQRPVNFDRASNSQIRWGFNFGKSFGEPAAAPAAAPAGGPRARPAGAGARPTPQADAPPPGDGKAAPPPEGAGGADRGPRAAPPPGAAPRGGGMRGRGGPFGRPQGGRWQVSLYHTLKLTDTVLIRPGVPELDLLDGSATGSGGGSNRNLVELDGGVFYKGIGARVRAKYDSGSSVAGGANGDLTFHPLATFDLRIFADFSQMPKVTDDLPFLKNSRLRLSVNNLFDAQRRVTDASGAVPLNYQPGYTDPIGRYIELEWRKSF